MDIERHCTGSLKCLKCFWFDFSDHSPGRIMSQDCLIPGRRSCHQPGLCSSRFLYKFHSFHSQRVCSHCSFKRWKNIRLNLQQGILRCKTPGRKPHFLTVTFSKMWASKSRKRSCLLCSLARSTHRFQPEKVENPGFTSFHFFRNFDWFNGEKYLFKKFS